MVEANTSINLDIFPDQIKIWEDVAEYGENSNYKLLYQGRANIQENGSGSEVDNVIKSDYVAYCEDKTIKINSRCKLDWSGFNKPFSENPNNWNEIVKRPFNYENFGTVIYFDEVGN